MTIKRRWLLIETIALAVMSRLGLAAIIAHILRAQPIEPLFIFVLFLTACSTFSEIHGWRQWFTGEFDFCAVENSAKDAF